MRRRRNSDDKDVDSDEELDNQPPRWQEVDEGEREEDNPRVDVEPDDGDGDHDDRNVAVPSGLLDFDWRGERYADLVETDGAVSVAEDVATERPAIRTMTPSSSALSVTTRVASSIAASTTSLATSSASLAASTTSIAASTAEDESEFRSESQASMFSQSSLFSVASSRETQTDVDSARGSGAASSLSTIGSQDSGFGGSQDSFLLSGTTPAAVPGDHHPYTSPFSRVDGMPIGVRRGGFRRRNLVDVEDVKFVFDDSQDSMSAGGRDPSSPTKRTTHATTIPTTSSSSKSSTLPPNLSLFAKDEASSSSSKVYWENEEEDDEGRRYSFDRSTENLACDNYWRSLHRLRPACPDDDDDDDEESGFSPTERRPLERFIVDRENEKRPKSERREIPSSRATAAPFVHSVHSASSSSGANKTDADDSNPPFRRPDDNDEDSNIPFVSPLRDELDPERTVGALFRAPRGKTLTKTSTESLGEVASPRHDLRDNQFVNAKEADTVDRNTRDLKKGNEVMDIMDSLPQLDRLRNISGGSSATGSSATGSSTEELSTASGDDADLFKRPADRPVFSRKRKDRQSSGSSTASAFRHADSPHDHHHQRREHKRGKGHRTSTVIFSIRGSSPNSLADTPSVTTVTSSPSVPFSSSSMSFARSSDAFATLLNSHGTTISVNSGSITSFTVKKRSKLRSSKPQSERPAEAPAEAPAKPRPRRQITTTESSTQCDDVQPSTSSQRTETSTDDALNDKCIICLTRPKNASIIHGYLGHQVCCCKCARKLRRLGKPCPICRRPIQHIVKNVIV